MGYSRILLDGHYLPALMSLIGAAEKEILIATFKIQSSPKTYAKKLMSIYTGLARAVNRGVKVKILTNLFTGGNLAAHVNTVTARQLRQYGIEVQGLKKPRIVHSKICVVDGQACIIGSHNFSTRALVSNYETSIYIKDVTISNILRTSFCSLWEESGL